MSDQPKLFGRFVLLEDYQELQSKLDAAEERALLRTEDKIELQTELDTALRRLSSVSKLLDDWRHAWDRGLHESIPAGIEQIRAAINASGVEKREPLSSYEAADEYDSSGG